MAIVFGIIFGVAPAVIHLIRRRLDSTDVLIDMAFLFLSAGAGYFVGIKSWNHHEDRFLAIQRVKSHGAKPDGPSESN